MLEKLKDLDHVVDIGYSAYYNDFLKITKKDFFGNSYNIRFLLTQQIN